MILEFRLRKDDDIHIHIFHGLGEAERSVCILVVEGSYVIRSYSELEAEGVEGGMLVVVWS